jgi:putative spermidine/putrescine transport system ATP-binding protein
LRTEAGWRIVVPAPASRSREEIAVALRADRVAIGDTIPGDAPTDRFVGEIRNVEFHGPVVHLRLAVPGTDDFAATIDETSFFARPFTPGQRVELGCRVEDLHLLEAS